MAKNDSTVTKEQALDDLDALFADANMSLSKAVSVIKLARQSLPETDAQQQDAIVGLYIAEDLLTEVYEKFERCADFQSNKTAAAQAEASHG